VGPRLTPARFTDARGRLPGLGWRRGSGRSWFRAGATASATPSRCPAFGSASRSDRARADMGCAPTGGADLAHCSRPLHVGSRTDRAPGGAQRPVVGPFGRWRPTRSDLGVARARAIHFCATACPVMGRQQAGNPGGFDAGTVMGFARKRLQAARFRLGRACAGVLGRRRGIGAERSSVRGAVLERARRPGMGCHQDPGARRPGRTIVVGAIGRAGATSRTAAAGAHGSNPATAARCSSVVASGRVSGSADVPRACSHGRVAGHGALAAG
jgi:hypothetical protein